MRKGQTATEYLMTYGWAILIIVVVVCALWAMGVFGKTPIPEQKTFCEQLCVKANMTFYNYGGDYCECQPLKKNCITIGNTEYCKDEGQSWIVKYIREAP